MDGLERKASYGIKEAGPKVKKRILITDDSAPVRKALHAFLEREDHWVVVGEATNGREALDKAHELKPDLVTLDLSMPLMNGIDAAKELKRSYPNLPIVLFTNFAETDLEAIAVASGASAVIPKSEPGALVAKIYSLLGSTPSQRSIHNNLIA
jgi:DNA-binding NarL/FixJ family response regulator